MKEHIKDTPCVGVINRLGFQRKKDRKTITLFTSDEVEAILPKAWNIVHNGIPYSWLVFVPDFDLVRRLCLNGQI